MPTVLTLITTADKREALENMGRILLRKRLIACIQISGPMTSMYWWKGVLEETEEWAGTMKTRSELYDQVERELKSLHPYEVPEIAAVQVTRVSADYAEWVRVETNG